MDGISEKESQRPAWQVDTLDQDTAGRGLFPGYACTFTIPGYREYGHFCPPERCELPGHLFCARADNAIPEVFLSPTFQGRPGEYQIAEGPIYAAWKVRVPTRHVPGARFSHVRPHPGPWELWCRPDEDHRICWHLAVVRDGGRREFMIPGGRAEGEFLEVQVIAREREVAVVLAGEERGRFSHDPYPASFQLRFGSAQTRAEGGEVVSEFREVFVHAVPYPGPGVPIPDGPEDVRPGDDICCYFAVPATPSRPRHSEGDLIERQDGSLLLIWSEYWAGVGHDRSPARLSALISRDQGRTWGEHGVVATSDAGGADNVMSASLVRNGAGRLLLAYHDRTPQMPVKGMVLRVSDDEGATWGERVPLTPLNGNLHAANNASFRVLSSGRILLACREYVDGIRRPYALYSNDEGATWSAGRHVPDPELSEDQRRGQNINEPSIAELADGRLLMTCRSIAGGQFFTFSEDGGQTWSRPYLSPLRGACSPATLATIPGTGDVLALFTYGYAGRTPLVSAVSGDGGSTWCHLKQVEQSQYHGYCYTSITFVDDRVLLTYMHYPLFTRLMRFEVEPHYMDLRFTSLPLSWFYRDP